MRTVERYAFEATRDEWFRFCAYTFNVSKARDLIGKRRAVVKTIAVSDLRPLLAEKTEKGIRLGVGVDWERVEKDIAAERDAYEPVLDLTVPLIVAQTSSGALPIDGWHRIAKAVRVGREKLPYVLLTKKESRACCVSGLEEDMP